MSDNVCTSLYKLNNKNIDDFYNFLLSNKISMENCIGYEVLFAKFIITQKVNKIINLNKIGISGYISVSHDFIDC